MTCALWFTSTAEPAPEGLETVLKKSLAESAALARTEIEMRSPPGPDEDAISGDDKAGGDDDPWLDDSRAEEPGFAETDEADEDEYGAEEADAADGAVASDLERDPAFDMAGLTETNLDAAIEAGHVMEAAEAKRFLEREDPEEAERLKAIWAGAEDLDAATSGADEPAPSPALEPDPDDDEASPGDAVATVGFPGELSDAEVRDGFAALGAIAARLGLGLYEPEAGQAHDPTALPAMPSTWAARNDGAPCSVRWALPIRGDDELDWTALDEALKQPDLSAVGTVQRTAGAVELRQVHEGMLEDVDEEDDGAPPHDEPPLPLACWTLRRGASRSEVEPAWRAAIELARRLGLLLLDPELNRVDLDAPPPVPPGYR